MGEVHPNLPGMVGRHPRMLSVYQCVRKVAGTRLPVFITGETGTGKELVAQAVHAVSDRAGGPFIEVNSAAIVETLAESELFGAEKGAYTGSVRRVEGLLQLADGGTLFLDEVCSMPLGMQAKLLRALESGQHRRVGGRTLVRFQVRIVAAACEPVATLRATGRIRPDLSFRLAGVEVRLPALRERRSDIDALVCRFLEQNNGDPVPQVTAEALSRLRAHGWPGNVRELKNAVERIALFAEGGAIDLKLVHEMLGPTPESLDEDTVEQALSESGGSVRGAARALGVPRSTLQRWMARRNGANGENGERVARGPERAGPGPGVPRLGQPESGSLTMT